MNVDKPRNYKYNSFIMSGTAFGYRVGFPVRFRAGETLDVGFFIIYVRKLSEITYNFVGEQKENEIGGIIRISFRPEIVHGF